MAMGQRRPTDRLSPADPAVWSLLLGAQAGLCIAGIGVLTRQVSFACLGGGVTAVIAIPLVIQVIAVLVGYRPLGLAAGIATFATISACLLLSLAARVLLFVVFLGAIFGMHS